MLSLKVEILVESTFGLFEAITSKPWLVFVQPLHVEHLQQVKETVEQYNSQYQHIVIVLGLVHSHYEAISLEEECYQQAYRSQLQKASLTHLQTLAQKVRLFLFLLRYDLFLLFLIINVVATLVHGVVR